MTVPVTGVVVVNVGAAAVPPSVTPAGRDTGTGAFVNAVGSVQVAVPFSEEKLTITCLK